MLYYLSPWENGNQHLTPPYKDPENNSSTKVQPEKPMSSLGFLTAHE